MKHNWEYKRLGEVCNFIGGGTPSKSNDEFYTGSIPWATVRDMLTFKLYKTELCITEDAVNNSATNILPKGMIVISTHVGLGKICELMQDTAINQDLKGISFTDNSIDKYFFTYWYRSIANFIISKGRGATVKGVTLDFMRELNIPVPPLHKQEQIVVELDKINSAIEDCREVLRNLGALAQSLFYDYFGDPVTNSKGWELRKFVDVCNTFTDGDWIESKDQSTDGFRLIQTGNIGKGIYLDKSERSKFISDDTFYSLKCKEVFEGDILISRLPDPIGRACILPKLPLRSITAVDCTIVRPKPCILPSFLLQYTLTDAYFNGLSSITKGSTRKRVSRGNLGKVLIPVPPLELQEKFTKRIEQINAQKKAVEETIANLQTLLDSRMDYWFN